MNQVGCWSGGRSWVLRIRRAYIKVRSLPVLLQGRGWTWLDATRLAEPIGQLIGTMPIQLWKIVSQPTRQPQPSWENHSRMRRPDRDSNIDAPGPQLVFPLFTTMTECGGQIEH